ncbi:helix-turn-helix transcriptional regulator [Aristaeella lactis]|uniref:GTP pyrophosphokinase n=2 Tax=Aristaeella lactis TaxID=3046383 RepID=A0AC61PL35_9FIRM|nr:helix-turn-helix transcriptional regulator [Aristaeella lactis]QUA52161.1 helix-turn-helix domain-containing protein [Aristaeella lactis]SMC58291.1 GTP pyrophosphokinase [Aristaeella lactis]
MTENGKMNKVIGERIKAARLVKGLSQEKLGDLLGVSFQAVSSWETGKFIPDSDHLAALAKALDLSLDALFVDEEKNWELGRINYDPEHMFTRVKVKAEEKGMFQTLRVLDLLRPAHGAQPRKSKYGFKASYTVHPLTMACHALAMGLVDDDVLAACLAHDMVEDAHMKPEDLPVNDRVREAVRLVSKNMYDPNDPDWEKKYFENIRENPLACLVKCLDRVNNLAGMADAFSRKKMIRYTAETDKYYPALLEVVKKTHGWNDAWWLLRYQMMTMVETFKRLL